MSFVKIDTCPMFSKNLFERVVPLEKTALFRVAQVDDQFLCFGSQPRSTNIKTVTSNLQNICNLIDQEEYNVSRIVIIVLSNIKQQLSNPWQKKIEIYYFFLKKLIIYKS